MTIEVGQTVRGSYGKQIVTLYGSEAEILAADMSNYATGSFGVSEALDVYFYTEGGAWTKNGEEID